MYDICAYESQMQSEISKNILSILYWKLTSMLNVDVIYSTCTIIHIMPFFSDGDEGEVEMKDVWFSYPSRPNEDVLKVCHLRYDACHFLIKLSNMSSEME
mgnify:FL=1